MKSYIGHRYVTSKLIIHREIKENPIIVKHAKLMNISAGYFSSTKQIRAQGPLLYIFVVVCTLSLYTLYILVEFNYINTSATKFIKLGTFTFKYFKCHIYSYLVMIGNAISSISFFWPPQPPHPKKNTYYKERNLVNRKHLY